jgi:hypothetical protein
MIKLEAENIQKEQCRKHIQYIEYIIKEYLRKGKRAELNRLKKIKK